MLFPISNHIDAVLGFRSFTMQLATSNITLNVNFHENQPGYDTKIIMQKKKKKSALMTLHNSSSINTVNINNTHTK